MANEHRRFLDDLLGKVCRKPTLKREVLPRLLGFTMSDGQRAYVEGAWKQALQRLNARVTEDASGRKMYCMRESVKRPKVKVTTHLCSWCGKMLSDSHLLVRTLTQENLRIHHGCYNPKEHYL